MELKEIYQKDLEKIRKEFHLNFEPPEVPNFSPTILATAWHDDWYGYDFHEITKKDTVLDIGAETGLFSLLAARLGAKVYSIEPISTHWVEENIRKNNLSHQITILPFAFGGNKEITCQHHFQGPNVKKIQAHDLEYIFENIDDMITIIKCDCEGYEYDGFQNTTNFRNIRKIDMEVHVFKNKNDRVFDLIKQLKDARFEIEYNKPFMEEISLGILRAKK